MINLTIFNILGYSNDILDFKKEFDKTVKNISAVSEDLLSVCDVLKVYEYRADNLSNNLRLNEIFILIFIQFYCKINRNQLKIVVEATYGLHPS